MHKRFILLLGVFLGSHVLAAAQRPTPQIVPTQGRVAPIVTMVPTVRVPLSQRLSCCPTTQGNPRPISVTGSRVLTNVTRA